MTVGERAIYKTHETRISMDASTYDEICVRCGATDQVPGGWGTLVTAVCDKETEEHRLQRLDPNRAG